MHSSHSWVTRQRLTDVHACDTQQEEVCLDTPVAFTVFDLYWYNSKYTFLVPGPSMPHICSEKPVHYSLVRLMNALLFNMKHTWIHARSVENAQMILRVDNARVAADDFKMKLATEANMSMKMEGDVACLRGDLDSFTLTRSDLEMQIEGLKEELVYLRRNHEEEMQLMQTQQCGAVNVEMDCASSVDMSKVLEEIRTMSDDSLLSPVHLSVLLLQFQLFYLRLWNTEIHARSVENAQMILRVDNARVAADDFKMKLATEANMSMKMEGDVACLRGDLDSFTLTRSDLEMQIEGLKEELVYLRRNHEEEMQLMQTQQCGAVNVEMDCASSVDMSKVLEEMRTQSEGMVTKNKRDAAKWFESKVEVLQSQITTSTTELKTSQSQVTDPKRTFQSLEIELHGLLTQNGYLEQSVADINGRHGSQLSQLQVCINSMEEELQQLNVSIQQQASEYSSR
ncbi:keratin, type I cytoskeletal 42-like [Oncorhynchus kisutch]|uniref:keratin, type I cytoskeletal 42-like n=1 Tax=Oncorhynchus kisutch TaxID=8019 RepID=UPI0012DBDD06|nr:keratin, type I cytoskeletal 42-like [Oncorhynchus kisutch]